MAARQKGIVVPITATDNTARAFESVGEQVTRLRTQVAELRSQLSGGNGPGERLAHGMSEAVPRVAAASGAIREFEGNLPIRAVENFLSYTLGLGPALSKIFPLVGAIAFAGAVGEAVGKLHELYEQGHNAADAISKGFGDMNEKLQESNDSLDLQNAKLEDQIGKLSGHPTNGLATALAEARVEADKLQESLEADIKALNQLLDQHDVSAVSGVLSGVAPTSGVKGEITKQADDVRKASLAEQTAYLEALVKAGANQKAQEDATKAHYARMAEIAGNAANEMRRRVKEIDAQQAAINDPANFTAPVADFGRSGASGISFAPKDLTAQRNELSGAADTFSRIQARAQLSGTNTSDTVTLQRLQEQKRGKGGTNKAEEEARKLREAQDRLAAAQRQYDDAEVKREEDAAKSRSAGALAALESSHKQQLTSDEDFYRQKAEIQAEALAGQKGALDRQEANLQAEADRLSGQKLTGNDATLRDAKVLDLKAKIVALDGQSARLTAEQAKNTAQLATELDELADKRLKDADTLAARLERTLGGSTSARSRQSRDQYSEERNKLLGEFGGASPAVSDLDRQQGVDQASIAAGGANDSFGRQNGSINRQRSAIDAASRRGDISRQEAQRQRIALDAQEANALGPVLAAYQALAATGDLNAADKVADLQQKIAELKNPVNEVAAEIRGQFDSAFESLFENLDRGKRGFADFGKAIERSITRDIYKSAVEPGLQAALGVLIPNSRNPSLPNGSAVRAGAGGLLGKVLHNFGGNGKSGGNLKVEIINQSGQPLQAASANQKDLQGEFKDSVISIVLHSASTGGPLAQLFV